MRIITQEVLDALASEEYRPTVLLQIVTESITLSYTMWDYPIFCNACYLYTPRGFKINAIRFGSAAIVDSVSVKIDDVSREVYKSISEPFGQYVGCNVSIAVLDRAGEVLGATDVFAGSVTEWFYSAGSVDLKVSSIFSQWSTTTTSTFSGSCRWRIFKGTECAYAGSELSCSRTYSQCSTYGNTDNFGGFRWVQSLEDKVDPAKKTQKYWTVRGS